jgi:uncharacterized membrane protein YkoI
MRGVMSGVPIALCGVVLFGGSAAPAFADDGLTRDQASRVQRAALKKLRGTVIDIDRDNGRSGAIRFSATVLTRSGAVREFTLDRRYRVIRRERHERPQGLTYRRALRAKSAARNRLSGVVTGVDTEDEGRARYEVDVLRHGTTEYRVRLSSSFNVLGTRRLADTD